MWRQCSGQKLIFWSFSKNRIFSYKSKKWKSENYYSLISISFCCIWTENEIINCTIGGQKYPNSVTNPSLHILKLPHKIKKKPPVPHRKWRNFKNSKKLKNKVRLVDRKTTKWKCGQLFTPHHLVLHIFFGFHFCFFLEKLLPRGFFLLNGSTSFSFLHEIAFFIFTT